MNTLDGRVLFIEVLILIVCLWGMGSFLVDTWENEGKSSLPKGCNTLSVIKTKG